MTVLFSLSKEVYPVTFFNEISIVFDKIIVIQRLFHFISQVQADLHKLCGFEKQ